MKYFADNRFLTIALAGSVAIHAVLLGVHFAAPDAFRLKPADPGLEVILVNAKHDKAPVKADAIAQANLDGGGNANEGRAKSPLPDMRKVENGDSVKAAQRKVAELEAQQQKILSQMNKATPTVATPEREKPKEVTPQINARDLLDTAKAVARMEAEVAKNIEDYNKRPKKTQITARTREAGYALYYKAMQEKIERLGTLNFPQRDGKKLYGELVIYIPVFQDGTIYEKEGGARIERGSGNAALDSAALAIVRRSAPFGRFPDNMRTTSKDDIWEIITRFRFTHEETLQTDMSSSR
ncbi:TonB C-terminal domain-containing protein [Herbaspirillum rhizosphaerae]|uniref:TonB C-terminal domain-containing protein n=1 Tax=Herbaspirillum rhizosphaerae TaxID=346179 RepID=UPI00067BCCF5|nr:TonB C-terminal domain-containing protein [Herbaspirillum rhizosphaerae]